MHVHDLVDFVSEEAGTAGRNAAEYVKLGSERSSEGKEIRINPVEGVRYTVPGTIHTDRMDGESDRALPCGRCLYKLLHQCIF